MVAHASLTGADLHEPKGAASASGDTVYVADGSGSGSWKKIPSTSIDTASIKNVNKVRVVTRLADVSAASAVLIPIVEACTLDQVTTVLEGAITTADSVVTLTKTGGFSLGSITVAYSGSAEGDIDTLTPTSNNTFVAGNFLKIATDGASSTTQGLSIVLDFTLA